MDIKAISSSLKEYRQFTRSNSTVNKYAINLCKDTHYAAENIARFNDKDKNAFAGIINEIAKAPESLFSTLTFKLMQDKPNSFTELHDLRKNLRIICRKHPDANAYMKQLHAYLTENKDVSDFLNHITNRTNKYIATFLKRKNKLKISNEKLEYFERAKDLFDKTSKITPREHIDGFFNYITN